jgi:quercetin dioxygenase-like cupin family protein
MLPRLIAALIVVGAVTGIAIDRVATAQQPAGIKRTIIQRADDPGNPGYEAIMAIAELPAGATSGKHRHSGVEVAYVLEGSPVMESAGQAATTLKAGESVKNDVGVVHNVTNSSTKTVKILAVYLVEKGKPLAEPVP